MIHIVNATSLERGRKLLERMPGAIYKASYFSLNRAASTSKTQAGRFASEEYTISKATFMRNVNVRTKTFKNERDLKLIVSYAGNVLPLLEFDTKFSRGGRVQTKVKRKGSAALIRDAFVARVFGPTAIFERIGSNRFPVEQKFGPSTGQMMSNQEIVEKMDKTIIDTYEKRMEHEILRLMNGW